MFPDFDQDVLESVLVTNSFDFDTTIEQLLEMGSGGGGGGGGESVGVNSDEEIAMALFHQFADDLENQLSIPIPPEVRADPERYERFVREQFEAQLARNDSSLARRAQDIFTSRCGPPPSARTYAPDRRTLTPRMRAAPRAAAAAARSHGWVSTGRAAPSPALPCSTG